MGRGSQTKEERHPKASCNNKVATANPLKTIARGIYGEYTCNRGAATIAHLLRRIEPEQEQE